VEEKWFSILVKIVTNQYRAIIYHALRKSPAVDAIHLYPLLPMKGRLLELNLRALDMAWKDCSSFQPDMTIFFHNTNPLDKDVLPTDKVWTDFLDSLSKTSKVTSQLWRYDAEAKDGRNYERIQDLTRSEEVSKDDSIDLFEDTILC
jgi:hypothetical protein